MCKNFNPLEHLLKNIKEAMDCSLNISTTAQRKSSPVCSHAFCILS